VEGSAAEDIDYHLSVAVDAHIVVGRLHIDLDRNCSVDKAQGSVRTGFRVFRSRNGKIGAAKGDRRPVLSGFHSVVGSEFGCLSPSGVSRHEYVNRSGLNAARLAAVCPYSNKVTTDGNGTTCAKAGAVRMLRGRKLRRLNPICLAWRTPREDISGCKVWSCIV